LRERKKGEVKAHRWVIFRRAGKPTPREKKKKQFMLQKVEEEESIRKRKKGKGSKQTGSREIPFPRRTGSCKKDP